MNHYPHHIGDYLKDTAHLDPLEDGIYRRMIDLYYTQEGPLEACTVALCRRLRLDQKKHSKALQTILNEFFSLNEEGTHYRHSRCDREIASYIETAGDREQKAAHEADRMRRYRERRKDMFESLRSHGVIPKWDIAMDELQRLYDTTCNAHETRTGYEQNANASSIDTANQNQNQNQNQEPIKPNTRRGQAALCSKPDDVPEKIWNDFQVIRKAKRAPLTQTALDGISTEAKRAGISLAAALGECCARGWQGFKADWITKEINGVDYGQCTWNLHGDREAGGRCSTHAAGLHKFTGMARCAVHIARN